MTPWMTQVFVNLAQYLLMVHGRNNVRFLRVCYCHIWLPIKLGSGDVQLALVIDSLLFGTTEHGVLAIN